MESVDYKKTLKHLYQPTTKEVVEVVVPSINFLMLDGAGDPNTSLEYQQAVEALYSVAYAIKFMVKKGPIALDFGVMPLEGLWWSDDMSTFSVDAKSDWKWTMMIMQPSVVTADMVAKAIDSATKKGVSAVDRLRFEAFEEGRCAQIMHIGPFSAEGPTVERIHTYIDSRGGRRGKHHEIYLSDIRKADPAKWKTVIRQPMND